MRQGLFFSTCEGLVGEALDLDSLAGEHAELESVRIYESFYDGNAFDELLEEVRSKKLDSLVLAGESPMAYRQTRNGEQLFRRLAERGVDRNRIEVVNLINMVVKPHKASREALQKKAQLLVDVGLAKVKDSQRTETLEISPRQAVAVIGVSASSVAVAQLLLDEGYKVFLVNNTSGLSLPKEQSAHIQPTLAYVIRHPRFTRYDEATVVDFHGYTGDYVLTIGVKEKNIELPVGAVVLSLEASSRLIKQLQAVFHIDIDEDGHLAARDETSARSQTQERGIFVVNPVRTDGDSLAAELLAADGAAAMAINLLNRKEIYHQVTVSQVNVELCGGCGSCVKTCMFKAVSLVGDPPVSVIDPRRCRGCGNCVTACPAGARDLVVCPTSYLFSAVDILSSFEHAEGGKKILAIGCDGCGYRCLDRAADMGLSWPIGIMPLWVVCGGQIDTQLIMHAFVRGFDGVVLLICGEGCCHNLVGNVDLERRANLFREILASRGIDHGRMHIVSTCSRKSSDCVQKIQDFCAQLGNRQMVTSTVVLS